jgi:hypothetical protein
VLPARTACIDKSGDGLDAANKEFGKRVFKVAHAATRGGARVENGPNVQAAHESVDESGGHRIAGAFMSMHVFVPRGGIRVIPALNFYGLIPFGWHSASCKVTNIGKCAGEMLTEMGIYGH